jgi:hypothetical protein
MTRAELEHAIRAACDVAEDTELIVFGSQAILGQYPEAPERLRGSVEVDVQPKNKPEAIDKVDGALGELSQFHATFGFYVHGVSIEAAALPQGWEERTIRVYHPVRTSGNIGHCLEAHDLSASKLVAYRDKDRDFVRTLLVERLINPAILLDRIEVLDVSGEARGRLSKWVSVTVEEIG